MTSGSTSFKKKEKKGKETVRAMLSSILAPGLFVYDTSNRSWSRVSIVYRGEITRAFSAMPFGYAHGFRRHPRCWKRGFVSMSIWMAPGCLRVLQFALRRTRVPPRSTPRLPRSLLKSHSKLLNRRPSVYIDSDPCSIFKRPPRSTRHTSRSRQMMADLCFFQKEKTMTLGSFEIPGILRKIHENLRLFRIFRPFKNIKLRQDF